MLSPAVAVGQVTASISGRVEDASGGVVRGATVTVKSLETGATRAVTTDEAGNYRILSLPLGPQEVKAEKAGLQDRRAHRDSIWASGRKRWSTCGSKWATLVQQVTVSEEAPVVNTTTAPVSGMVGEREVKDLPLNGRSFDNLITLNPGAINYSAMKSANTSTSNGNTFSVAGRRTGDNLFLLNGIEYTGSSQLAVTPGGVSGELLGIDAVREFNVLTDTYGAEYGKRAGAQVSVVTQSGTNALHGTLFEFLRNSALDARNFFDQAFRSALPPKSVRRRAGRAAQEGPAVPVRQLRRIPAGAGAQQRQRGARRAGAPGPAAECRRASTTPVANLNRAMLPYMSFWPQPNGPELLANGVPSGTALSYNNPKRVHPRRLRHRCAPTTIGDRDTLSASLHHRRRQQPDPAGGSAVRLVHRTAHAGGQPAGNAHLLAAVLNTFRAGFSRAAFNLRFVSAGARFRRAFRSSTGAGRAAS